MGFFGKLFGSDSVIKKAAEGVYNGIDYAFHTDQEKSEHFLRALKGYEPFKLAQRYIAFAFTAVYLICFFAAFIKVMVMGAPYPAELTDLMDEFNVGWIMMGIITFYFGGGLVESARKND